MNSTSPAPLLSFPDIQAGRSYLARLPLTNPDAAQRQIIQFIDGLLNEPPGQAGLLALLEEARPVLASVQEELAKRYENKPVVLGNLEEGAFQQVLTGWRRIEEAYAFYARREPVAPTNPEAAGRMALVLHRRIQYIGQLVFEHYRARRELPAGLWTALHGLYSAAEEWGALLSPVDDSADKHSPSSSHCSAAYVAALLLDVVGPFSNSVRDIKIIRRWAGQWASLVTVHPFETRKNMPAFVLELHRDSGLHPPAEDRPLEKDARRLETARLASHIERLLAQLKERALPSQLGLGEASPFHARQLLEQVARPWSQMTALRKFRRFATSGTAMVCVGFEAMHFHISGAEFEQPDSAKAYSRSELDSLFTFRQMAEPSRQFAIRPQGDFPLDRWDVVNHSANGFRLARSSVGQRMGHSQLIALCPHDGDKFLLAQVSWLMQEQKGGLIAGVAVLPGLPTGVAMRPADPGRDDARKFARAFLLSPVPSISQHESIILPGGSYRAGGLLEVHGQEVMRIRMKNILQKGVDFERVSYEPA